MGLLCGLNATPTTHTPTTLNRPTPSPSCSASLTDATTTTTKSQMSHSQQSKQQSVVNDPRENVDEETESATKTLQKAFRKYYSANSEGKVDTESVERIMEMMNGNATKTSPVLTIKRGGRNAGQWQDFIDREQSSVDQLIRDSFAVFCKDLHEDDKTAATISHSAAARYQRRNSSESRANMSSLPRTNKMFLAKSFSNGGGGTLPRTPPKVEGLVTSSAPRVPRGIEELEMLYAPMKNLSMPLPNARKYSGTSMPQPHPLVDWRNELQIVEDFERRKSCDDDQVSKM